MELSEAAALADVFVFRLMFRLYTLPRTFAQYVRDGTKAGRTSEQFHQSKRQLSAFAAYNYRAKVRDGGKTLEYDRYLTLSALTLDPGVGACTALTGQRCGIYERRPLACRAVPFGYSRAEAALENDLRTFVATPGYRCDTTEAAPVVLEAGRIVDVGIRRTRTDALALAERDRRWARAIVRRLKTGCSTMPSLAEIEANAPFGATTISMSAAWQIAAETGILGAEECRSLVEAQKVMIERELAAGTLNPDHRETLLDMDAEYRQLLGAGCRASCTL